MAFIQEHDWAADNVYHTAALRPNFLCILRAILRQDKAVTIQNDEPIAIFPTDAKSKWAAGLMSALATPTAQTQRHFRKMYRLQTKEFTHTFWEWQRFEWFVPSNAFAASVSGHIHKSLGVVSRSRSVGTVLLIQRKGNRRISDAETARK